MAENERAHKLSTIMAEFNTWRDAQPIVDHTFMSGCVIAIVVYLRSTLSEQDTNRIMREAINTGHVLAKL